MDWDATRARAGALVSSGYAGARRLLRGIRYRRDIPILVAAVAVILTAWQVIETRRASNRELGLFREQLRVVQDQSRSAERQLALAEGQYESTVRPILVPIPESDSETPLVAVEEGLVNFRFKVQNVTDAPALSGSAYLVPPDENGDPCPPDYETSSTNQPVETLGIPPVPGGGTVTLVLQDASFLPDLETPNPADPDPEDSFICAAVRYADATGTEWMTEWQWQRQIQNEGIGRYIALTPWEPFEIRTCQLIDNPQPPPTHFFISCDFHAVD